MKSDSLKTLTTKALNELAAALEAGQSEGLRRFLTVAARFPRYSFRNVMLITSQRSDATQVAGFNSWKALGRFVKKGEKGIAIIAPCLVRRGEDAEAPAGQDDDGPETSMRFKAVHVFDISQTDGEALPELSAVRGDPGDSMARLKAFATSRGITVTYGDDELGTADGRSSGGRILLRSDLDSAHEFEVLAHELGHELLHHGSDRQTRKTEELEAEAVAYAVCTAVGLDAKAAAADYIHLYDGDKESLLASLERVRGAVREIVAGLGDESGN